MELGKLTYVVLSPCKGCEERKLKCHAACEKYKEYRKQVEEHAKKVREAKRKTYACSYKKFEKNNKQR